MSVTQVTQLIKALLDSDERLADLWVAGEVSNFSRASSGHCYFTLKDANSELRCVMWRHQAGRLARPPAQGDWVEAHGYVSVYERGGVYQLYADLVECGGIGARWLEFEKLKEKLQAEGLFAEARKRSLPRWPRRIGVVTSPSGAAFQDILNILRARFPLVEVVLSPSLVQGEEAPASLVQALARLNKTPDIDVIIVARGGGSLEDLWAFNDERVARAVAASRVPVVSGVGHETDFTITDFVADLRAPTPSAAAAAVVPDGRELRGQVRDMARRLVSSISVRLGRCREGLDRSRRLLRLHDPQRALAEQRQRVDDLVRRTTSALEHRAALLRLSLTGAEARLQALSPLQVLERGYAVVQDRVSGIRLASVRQVVLGSAITVHLHNGHLGAQVTEVLETGGL
jgi:exodeoxyribonuclease VII large subunit